MQTAKIIICKRGLNPSNCGFSAPAIGCDACKFGVVEGTVTAPVRVAPAEGYISCPPPPDGCGYSGKTVNAGEPIPDCPGSGCGKPLIFEARVPRPVGPHADVFKKLNEINRAQAENAEKEAISASVDPQVETDANHPGANADSVPPKAGSDTVGAPSAPELDEIGPLLDEVSTDAAPLEAEETAGAGPESRREALERMARESTREEPPEDCGGIYDSLHAWCRECSLPASSRACAG